MLSYKRGGVVRNEQSWQPGCCGVTTVTLILSGSCVFWQRGMNEEPCPEAGTLQGIKTGREVTGAVTHRCLVKEG